MPFTLPDGSKETLDLLAPTVLAVQESIQLFNEQVRTLNTMNGISESAACDVIIRRQAAKESARYHDIELTFKTSDTRSAKWAGEYAESLAKIADEQGTVKNGIGDQHVNLLLTTSLLFSMYHRILDAVLFFQKIEGDDLDELKLDKLTQHVLFLHSFKIKKFNDAINECEIAIQAIIDQQRSTHAVAGFFSTVSRFFSRTDRILPVLEIMKNTVDNIKATIAAQSCESNVQSKRLV